MNFLCKNVCRNLTGLFYRNEKKSLNFPLRLAFMLRILARCGQKVLSISTIQS